MKLTLALRVPSQIKMHSPSKWQFNRNFSGRAVIEKRRDPRVQLSHPESHQLRGERGLPQELWPVWTPSSWLLLDRLVHFRCGCESSLILLSVICRLFFFFLSRQDLLSSSNNSRKKRTFCLCANRTMTRHSSPLVRRRHCGATCWCLRRSDHDEKAGWFTLTSPDDFWRGAGGGK